MGTQMDRIQTLKTHDNCPTGPVPVVVPPEVQPEQDVGGEPVLGRGGG